MEEQKPVLAIETSENLCGVCAYFDDNKYFELNINLKHSHSKLLFDLIETINKYADINVNDYKYIAVSSGPGSFTGLRIGMSAAKGIALGADLPIIPVPTFDAFAFMASSFLPDNTEFIFANKVNREEVYYSKYVTENKSYNIIDDIRILSFDDAKNKIRNTLHFGNLFLNSDKNNLYNFNSPTSLFIAKWSEIYGKDLLTYNFDYLEPNYLKNFIIKDKKNVI